MATSTAASRRSPRSARRWSRSSAPPSLATSSPWTTPARSTASRSTAGRAENQVTTLEEGRFIPGFATGIAGMSPGETKDVEAVFPSDYSEDDAGRQNGGLHGNAARRKAARPPAHRRRFRQGDLRKHHPRGAAHRRAPATRDDRASPRERAIGNEVMERLMDAHEFPLPKSMVDGEVEQLMNDARRMPRAAASRSKST